MLPTRGKYLLSSREVYKKTKPAFFRSLIGDKGWSVFLFRLLWKGHALDKRWWYR